MLTFKALLKEIARPQGAQGADRRQGRGHAQHGRAPDRLLHLRAQVHEARRQGELTPDQLECHLARGAGGEPGAGDRAEARLRGVLGLRAALHPFAVLRLRLCLRRLPRELALRALRGGAPGVRRPSISTCWKPAAPSTTPSLLAPFGLDASKPEFWNKGLEGHRRHDRRARSDGRCAPESLHCLPLGQQLAAMAIVLRFRAARSCCNLSARSGSSLDCQGRVAVVLR